MTPTTPHPMTAASLARDFLHLWHDQIHHGWAAAVPALEAVLTTYAERLRGEALEECAKLADETRLRALQEMDDDRKELGILYDPNSYGAGHIQGERSAAYDIAEAIRALSPTTEPTRQGNEGAP